MSGRWRPRAELPPQVVGTMLLERSQCTGCGSVLYPGAVALVEEGGRVTCGSCLRSQGVLVRDGRSHWRPM